MAPKYKLTYFTIRGLGEPIRFILSYMGTDFEDERIKFSDWPLLKPKAPFGKLPYIEINGKKIAQSVAILRYLGKQAGLAGDNDLENLMIDEAVDVMRDMIEDYMSMVKEQNPVRQAEMKEKFMKDVLPPQLDRFDKHVKENGGYVANNKLSWGDIFYAAFFDFMVDMLGLDLTHYPNLDKLRKKVFNIPRIKSWIENRPQDTAIVLSHK